MTCPPDRVYEEIAYISYHFHWRLADVLDLEHAQRARFVREIARLNERINGESGEKGHDDRGW
ncbi:DUF6760 family protein [Streptomyces yaizuensis]|uniref:DUF6760 family protein n=1 Tax=Streptomyces yaizuensis TaxID=2989713 RepID=UPI002B1FBA3C|nr:DUF6760 family protein [Streptomyces sp. YSPA8]